MAAARKLLLLATFVEFASAAKVADGRGGGVLVTSHDVGSIVLEKMQLLGDC